MESNLSREMLSTALSGKLTGLSSKKAALQLLGEVVPLMKRLFTSSIDCNEACSNGPICSRKNSDNDENGKNNTKKNTMASKKCNVDDVRDSLTKDDLHNLSKVVDVLGVVVSECTEALVSHPTLPVDIIKCSTVYFQFFSETSGVISCDEVLKIVNASTIALEESCADKDFDALIKIVPLLPSMCRSFSSLSHEAGLPIQKFLSELFLCFSHICISYSNQKKLFTHCTTYLHCIMDIYVILNLNCTSSNFADSAILSAVDEFLSNAMFGDENIVKEISSLSLASLESMNLLRANALGMKDKSRKEKKSFFPYHADLMFSLGKWCSKYLGELVDNDAQFRASAAVRRTLFLYVDASKRIYRSENKSLRDDFSSSLVKWRSHIKRILHAGIATAIVIKQCCLEGPNTHESAYLFGWSAVMDAIRRGLCDEMISTDSHTPSENTGAIPNHDSMIPYLEQMNNMGSSIVNGNIGDVSDIALYPRILFIGKLFDVNYRSMLDSVPALLRLVCRSCNKISNAKVEIHVCDDVTSSLFLQLLKLHIDIRRLDVFLQALLVESLKYPWLEHNVMSLYKMLTEEEVQTVLIDGVNCMPDGQRKLVWEAIYSALKSVSGRENEVIISPDCSPPNLFVIEAVLIPFSVAQGNQNYRSVPAKILTMLLASVLGIMDNVPGRSLLDISACFHLSSVVMQIAGHFLSANIFSLGIPCYPHTMPYDASPSVKDSCEREWAEFCVVASGFVVRDSGESMFQNAFSLAEESINTNNHQATSFHMGAFLASLAKAIFSALAVFSVSSDHFSPIMKCLNNNHDDNTILMIKDSTAHLRKEVIMQLFQLLSNPVKRDDSDDFNVHCIVGYFPFLCILMLRELPMWGSIVEDLLLEPSTKSHDASAIENTCGAIVYAALRYGDYTEVTSCHATTLLSGMVAGFCDPDILELTALRRFISSSISKSFERVVIQSNLYYQTFGTRKTRKGSGKKQSLHSVETLVRCVCNFGGFPVDIYCEEWAKVSETCCLLLKLAAAECDSSNVQHNTMLALGSISIIKAILKKKTADCGVDFACFVGDLMTDDKKHSTCFLVDFPHTLGKVLSSSDATSLQARSYFLEFVKSLFEIGIDFLSGSDSNEPNSCSVTQVLLRLITAPKRLKSKSKIKPKNNSSDFILIIAALTEALDSHFVGNSEELDIYAQMIQSNLQETTKAIVSLPLSCLKKWMEDHQHLYLDCLDKLNKFIKHCLNDFNNLVTIPTVLCIVADCYSIVCRLHTITISMSPEGQDFDESGMRNMFESIFQVISKPIDAKGGCLFRIMLSLVQSSSLLVEDQYLPPVVVSGIVNEILSSFNSLLVKCGKCDELFELSVVYDLIWALFSAAHPDVREELIAEPLLRHICEVFAQRGRCFVDAGGGFVFSVLLTAMKAALGFGNSSIKSHAKSHDVVALHSQLRRKIVGLVSRAVTDLPNTVLTARGSSFERDLFCNDLNFGQILRDICVLLDGLLKQESKIQFESSRMFKKRKHMSNVQDVANDSSAMSVVFESCFRFLSTISSHLIHLSSASFQTYSEQSGRNLKSALCEIIHVLMGLVSCPSVPVLNSYVGSIVLLFRHLLFSSLISSSFHLSTASQASDGREPLALLGRTLMSMAASKHLQRHSYIIVSSVIDALSAATKTISGVNSSPQHPDLSVKDEVLRECLYPGVFALLDRCRSSRERKQIFALLRDAGGSRALYTDLHVIYQEEYKFIGKA